jgi:hypothetical protein
MLRSVEATIGTDGQVHLCEPLCLPYLCRAIVTILDEAESPELAMLSEQASTRDWGRPEEDEAWSHLQRGR